MNAQTQAQAHQQSATLNAKRAGGVGYKVTRIIKTWKDTDRLNFLLFAMLDLVSCFDYSDRIAYDDAFTVRQQLRDILDALRARRTSVKQQWALTELSAVEADLSRDLTHWFDANVAAAEAFANDPAVLADSFEAPAAPVQELANDDATVTDDALLYADYAALELRVASSDDAAPALKRAMVSDKSADEWAGKAPAAVAQAVNPELARTFANRKAAQLAQDVFKGGNTWSEQTRNAAARMLTVNNATNPTTTTALVSELVTALTLQNRGFIRDAHLERARGVLNELRPLVKSDNPFSERPRAGRVQLDQTFQIVRDGLNALNDPNTDGFDKRFIVAEIAGRAAPDTTDDRHLGLLRGMGVYLTTNAAAPTRFLLDQARETLELIATELAA